MNLTLSRSQAEFLASQAPVAACLSGLGSGKTWIGTLWADYTAIKFPKSLGLIGANTPAQLNTVVVPSMKKHLESWGIRHYLGERPPWPSRFDSHSNVLSIEGGSQVLLRSMFESGIDRGVRGLELDWAYVDEARDVEETVLDVLLGRMRGSVGPRQIRLTSTPNGKKGWLYRKFISAPQPGWLVVRGSTMSNARNLPPGYVEGLKSTYSVEQYNQEVLGNWVDSMEGMAYRFDKARHCVRKPCLPDQPIFFSLDLNVSPMIGVVCQFDERSRTMHVMEEIVIRDNAQTRVACQMLAGRYSHKVNTCLYMCDEAGAARSTRTTESDVLIMQEMIPKLFRASRSMNGASKPRVVDRVNAVNAMLDPADGNARLTIDPSCGELIADMETLSWDQYGKIDKSDPKRSHACLDPDTRILTPSGEKPLWSLSVGDEVISHLGVARITHGPLATRKESVELRIQGRRMISSWDHPFMTACGWSPAIGLGGETCVGHGGRTTTGWFTMAGCVSGETSMGITTRPGMLIDESFIRSSGTRLFLERGNPAWRYTTSTGTSRTTTSPTSPWCPNQDTPSYIRNPSMPPNWRPGHGIQAMPGRNGIRDTASRHGMDASRSTSSARNAGSCPSRSSREMGITSAPGRACPGTGGSQGSMTSPGHASRVASGSRRTNIEARGLVPRDAVPVGVGRVVRMGEREVLDIRTTHGTFIANGVMVSNSDAMGYAVHRLFPIGGGQAFGLDGSLGLSGVRKNIQAGFPAPVGA